ncbi:hypothetical protein A1D22_07775 [Pasteurellaceae bacterium LFhippo2]|nr:hypothetical protein [Pasteurellaceae bacterium LFhippo2]
MTLTENEFLQTANLFGLLSTFANVKPNDANNGFLVESSYKKSDYAFIELTDDVREKNNQLLCDYTGLGFELNGTKHQLMISSQSTFDEFCSKVYKQIQIKRIKSDISDNEFSNLILLAFFALRGSPDFKANLYALDILRQISTSNYLDLLFKLLTNISDLRQLNLNFRELQGQYLSGENKRNTQVRVNLRYFYDNLGDKLQYINQYKYHILQHNKEKIRSESEESVSFIDRLMFYKRNVLGKENTENEIEKLRKELGFIYDKDIDETIKRDQGIVKYARVFLDDECMGCKDKYLIGERTFKYRNSDRYYLELHHCISFSADRTLDQIDNLVKLCPACHRALTKNRADENYQKQLINNILVNAPKAKEFCLNFTDENNCVQFIYERLK